jgi:basic membrane lipoprotein Med (substrate-binding protein (PBP1-ABC) superfamily)/ABC-type branched-subunit amino acid transport system substrate-binding protein/predicted Ser/Thr protein kinase
MEDLTGKQFGPYKIVAPLGEGGMAAVYRAYQPSVDRFVALKVLPSYFAKDPAFVGRFEQEAKMLAKLQHVHILPVHDYGQAEGYTYFVMPFVDTGNLADMLKGEPLPLPQIQKIITQVAGALDHAHGLGVVHRDIKPSNVLIDRAGNCLLADFGIAKMVEGTTAFTQTGGIIGTPAYMSPEQIRGEKLDGRSDIYSLGVILYEMATGRAPYRAETPAAIFVKHLHDPLPPPHLYYPDIPEGVERVILKALAKERNDRFKTAGEMAAALAQGIAGELMRAPTAPSAGVPSAAAELPPAPRRLEATEAAPLPVKEKRPLPKWVWGLVGLVALAVIVVALISLLGGGGAEPTPTAEVASAGAPTAAPTQTPIPEPTEEPLPPTEPRPTPTRMPAAALGEFQAELPPDPWGYVIVPAGQPILIAFVGDLSGPSAYLGEAHLQAVQLALPDAEKILGRPVEPIVVDSGCSPDGGRAGAMQVIQNPNIVGVIGHTCSPSCAEGIPLYEEAHLVSLSPSCTASDLTAAGSPLFNRVALRDDWIPQAFFADIGSSQSYQDFAAAFKARYGISSGEVGGGGHGATVAYAYDATHILLQAIREVGLTDDGGNLAIGRGALARAVRATDLYPGVTGLITFDDAGERLPPEGAQACPLWVAMVTDVGATEENGFVQNALQGLERAAEELGVCIRRFQAGQAADYEPIMSREPAFDLVIAVGFQQGEIVAAPAELHPDRNFAVLDFSYDPPLPNVQNMVFQVDQPAFMAGYLAAAWADLKDPGDPRVAYVAGREIPPVMQYVVGYQSGAAYYNRQHGREVQVIGAVANTFMEPDVGAELGHAMIDQGADVVFAVGGIMGDGALTAARDRGKWGIGVDVDQYVTLPEVRSILLTSVLKRLDNAVFTLVQDALRGEFHGGQTTVGTLENGGAGLAPFHDFEDQIPEDIRRELEEIAGGLLAGRIATDW